MAPSAIELRIAIVAGAFGLLIWSCVKAVQAAKRGGKGMRAIGMAMMLSGWGSMRDPRNDTVAEAKDGRIEKGANAGDPPTWNTRK